MQFDLNYSQDFTKGLKFLGSLGTVANKDVLIVPDTTSKNVSFISYNSSLGLSVNMQTYPSFTSDDVDKDGVIRVNAKELNKTCSSIKSLGEHENDLSFRYKEEKGKDFIYMTLTTGRTLFNLKANVLDKDKDKDKDIDKYIYSIKPKNVTDSVFLILPNRTFKEALTKTYPFIADCSSIDALEYLKMSINEDGYLTFTSLNGHALGQYTNLSTQYFGNNFVGKTVFIPRGIVKPLANLLDRNRTTFIYLYENMAVFSINAYDSKDEYSQVNLSLTIEQNPDLKYPDVKALFDKIDPSKMITLELARKPMLDYFKVLKSQKVELVDIYKPSDKDTLCVEGTEGSKTEFPIVNYPNVPELGKIRIKVDNLHSYLSILSTDKYILDVASTYGPLFIKEKGSKEQATYVGAFMPMKVLEYDD